MARMEVYASAHREVQERKEPIDIANFIYRPGGQILTNKMLEAMEIVPNPEKNSKPLTADQILSKTGVERRFQAREFETPSHMAVEVMRNLLYDDKDFDAAIVSNSNPQNANISESLVHVFGSGKQFNLDVHAACSGFAESLAFLGEYPSFFRGKRVVAIASENYLDTLDPIDQTIFSAGAAGMNFVYEKDLRVIGSKKLKLPKKDSQALKMDVDPKKMQGRHRHIYVPRSKSGKFEQDGKTVFQLVRNNIPQLIIDSIHEVGLSTEDIDLVIPHQPSIQVLEYLDSQTRKLVGKQGEKPLDFFYDIKDGNLSSASALIALIKAMREGRVGRGDKIVIAQFGAGFYARSAVVEFG